MIDIQNTLQNLSETRLRMDKCPSKYTRVDYLNFLCAVENAVKDIAANMTSVEDIKVNGYEVPEFYGIAELDTDPVIDRGARNLNPIYLITKPGWYEAFKFGVDDELITNSVVFAFPKGEYYEKVIYPLNIKVEGDDKPYIDEKTIKDMIKELIVSYVDSFEFDHIESADKEVRGLYVSEVLIEDYVLKTKKRNLPKLMVIDGVTGELAEQGSSLIYTVDKDDDHGIVIEKHLASQDDLEKLKVKSYKTTMDAVDAVKSDELAEMQLCMIDNELNIVQNSMLVPICKCDQMQQGAQDELQLDDVIYNNTNGLTVRHDDTLKIANNKLGVDVEVIRDMISYDDLKDYVYDLGNKLLAISTNESNVQQQINAAKSELSLSVDTSLNAKVNELKNDFVSLDNGKLDLSLVDIDNSSLLQVKNNKLTTSVDANYIASALSTANSANQKLSELQESNSQLSSDLSALQSTVSDFTKIEYVKKSELDPITERLNTLENAESNAKVSIDLTGFAKESELTDFVKQDDIKDFLKLEDYQQITTAELANRADSAGIAKVTYVDDKINTELNLRLATYARTADLDSYIKTSNAASTISGLGFITTDKFLEEYATKEYTDALVKGVKIAGMNADGGHESIMDPKMLSDDQEAYTKMDAFLEHVKNSGYELESIATLVDLFNTKYKVDMSYNQNTGMLTITKDGLMQMFVLLMCRLMKEL